MFKKWIWAALAGLPLVIGGLVYAASQPAADDARAADSERFICPITGEELPCEKCCPLNK